MKTYISKKITNFQGLTFDDVLLKPGYSDFSRSEINLKTQLTKKIKLTTPFVSAPMDTVTESKLAIKLAELGGIGIIHRNLTIDNQIKEVKKVKEKKLLVGAAVGASNGYEQRVKKLVENKTDVIVIDSAHGFTKTIIDAIKYIKTHFSSIEVIAGNIATSEAALALIKAGVDGLRVGMGPGAICTTRIISGMGVPQITALFQVVAVASQYKVPVIADGGIKFSGDAVKALASGASTIMMGSVFASCLESPGQVFHLKPDQVPARFKSILKQKKSEYLFKSYRGMGSVGAMKTGTKIKTEEEFHGKSYKDRVMVAEGVEAMVPIKGTVDQIVNQFIGGIKSGMYYLGNKTINDLHQKAMFIPITHASMIESHPHSIFITNPGQNYNL